MGDLIVSGMEPTTDAVGPFLFDARKTTGTLTFYAFGVLQGAESIKIQRKNPDESLRDIVSGSNVQAVTAGDTDLSTTAGGEFWVSKTATVNAVGLKVSGLVR